MVFCGNCGTELNERSDIVPENRSPCPSCGSTKRFTTKELEGNLSPSGGLIAQKHAEDGTDSIRVADDNKRSSSVDTNDMGNIFYIIQGPSPKGEEGVLDVCRILINKLNREGEQWGEPSRPEGTESGIDCVASGTQGTLYIQVTRAVSDEKIWRQLSKYGSVTNDLTVEHAANELLERVKDKARNMPIRDLKNIVLAIDAMDTAGYSLESTIVYFKNRYSQVAHELGFKALWVVGPTEDLTYQLDS